MPLSNYDFVDLFLSLFIKRYRATTSPTATTAKTPIIMVPFAHDTNGIFENILS